MGPEFGEVLNWDSSFFGFRVARLSGDTLAREQIQSIDAWCRQAQVDCLCFLSRADDPITTGLAEDNGFRLVDIRLTFEYKPPAGATFEIPKAGYQIRSARPGDVEPLQDIAGQSHHDTRFYFDTRFPRPLCDQLYKTWIKRSCEDYADLVLVAELEGIPVGYISCHLDQADPGLNPTSSSLIGRIGIVGVSAQAQGRGIGQGLVLSAADWFLKQGAQKVTVVTQGRNSNAQRLYQRCGFLTQKVQLWYHKWYHEPDSL